MLFFQKRINLLTLQFLLAFIFVSLLIWSLNPKVVVAENRSHTENIMAAQISETVSVYWNDVALAAIRFSRPGPPVVARILAMVHTAQYEAWSQYDASAVGTLLGDRFR